MADSINPSQLAAIHEAGAALGLTLDDVTCEQLGRYLALLQRWSRVYNLTAVRDPAEMLTHHLFDSLAVVAPLRRQQQQSSPAQQPDQSSAPFRVLDVGSGAGLPGVVIALCCPDIEVTCVDAVGKKAAFIQQVAAELRIKNLRGLHARVETVQQAHSVIVSRAFASLIDFTAWSRGALAEGGAWLAMKGKHPAEEIAALPGDIEVFHVEPLQVPGLQAERCIVWMRPSAT